MKFIKVINQKMQKRLMIVQYKDRMEVGIQ